MSASNSAIHLVPQPGHLGKRATSAEFKEAILSELVNCHARHNSFGGIAQVLMVREIDDLACPCHLAKQPEHLLRPDVVDVSMDVVGDEGNRRPELGEL